MAAHGCFFPLVYLPFLFVLPEVTHRQAGERKRGGTRNENTADDWSIRNEKAVLQSSMGPQVWVVYLADKQSVKIDCRQFVSNSAVCFSLNISLTKIETRQSLWVCRKMGAGLQRCAVCYFMPWRGPLPNV